MEKRFNVCEKAPKVIEDNRTGKTFLCYNEDVAKELALYLNRQFPSENELFKLNIDQLVEAKLYTLQKIRIKQAKIIVLEHSIRTNETNLWLTTDFKAEGCTNDTMRKQFVRSEISEEEQQLDWLKHDLNKFYDDLDLIKTLLEVKKE